MSTDPNRKINHRICVVLRRHPSTIFWLVTCAAFLFGVIGSWPGLALCLAIELAAAVHVVNHTYQPRKDGTTDARGRTVGGHGGPGRSDRRSD